MHVVFAADRPATFGGIETHMATLARELCLMGKKVSLLFSRIDEPDLFTDARRAGAHVIELPKVKWLPWLAKNRPTLFHAHSAGAGAVGANVQRAFSLPVVVTLHGPGQAKRGLRPGMGIICVSEEIARQTEHIPLPQIIVENGVALSAFSPGTSPVGRPLRVLYVGRVGPSKRPGLAALEEAINGLPGVECRYASTWRPDGSASPSFDVASMMQWSDVVFSTGRGIREGMAAGNVGAVLGVHWDGLVTPATVKELQKCNFSGRSRRLCPTVQTIRPVLHRLLSEPETVHALKRFGIDYARQHFCARQMAEKTLRFYRLIASAPRPSSTKRGRRNIWAT